MAADGSAVNWGMILILGGIGIFFAGLIVGMNPVAVADSFLGGHYFLGVWGWTSGDMSKLALAESFGFWAKILGIGSAIAGFKMVSTAGK
jgi:hypothetical protein